MGWDGLSPLGPPLQVDRTQDNSKIDNKGKGRKGGLN